MKYLKKISFIAFAGTLFLASCKKDRVCECTSSVTFGSITQSNTSKTTITDASKRTAKDACISKKAEENGYTYNLDCKLK